MKILICAYNYEISHYNIELFPMISSYQKVIYFLKIDTNNSILKYLIASNQFKTCTTNYLIYLQFLLFILFLLIKLRSLFSLGNWIYYLVYIWLVTYGKMTTNTLIKIFSFSISQLFANRILKRKSTMLKGNLLYKNICRTKRYWIELYLIPISIGNMSLKFPIVYILQHYIILHRNVGFVHKYIANLKITRFVTFSKSQMPIIALSLSFFSPF